MSLGGETILFFFLKNLKYNSWSCQVDLKGIYFGHNAVLRRVYFNKLKNPDALEILVQICPSPVL